MANEITSVPKLIKGYESATSRLAKYKEQAAEVARRGTMGMAGLGGAALIGVVNRHGPDHGWRGHPGRCDRRG
jgi:hypothetical protein